MAGMKNDKYLITVSDTAVLLGTNPQQIRESIENGTFPFGRFYLSRANKKIYKISKNKILDFLGITEDEMMETLTVCKEKGY